jgi:predicted SprT family Zn-dependent metalloprotease
MFSKSDGRGRSDGCDASPTVEMMARELRVLTRVRKVAGSQARVVLALSVAYNPRLKRAYGCFRCTTTAIELAPWLRNDPRQLRDTFLHEVAHAIHFLAGNRGPSHGAEWKEVAQSLGVPPRACSDVEVEGQAEYRPRKARAIGRCESCGHVFYGRKALADGRRWTCQIKDEEGLVCHGDIRRYRSKGKRRSRKSLQNVRSKEHRGAVPSQSAQSAEPLLMTIPKAAKRAGIGVRQLRRAVRLEDVKAVMVGSWPRVHWESVVRWIGSQRVRATEDVKQKVAEAVQRRRSRQARKEDE